MVLEEKSVLFIATQKGFYNDKIIFEGEMFYAQEKINVSCDGDKSKLVPFESVTSWAKKMTEGK